MNRSVQHPPPIVRPAVRGDLSGVLALYRYLNPDDPAPDPARAEATWERILASDGTTVFVAELDGVLVATCMLLTVPNLTRDTGPFGLVENVVTHGEHRCRGYGRVVLDAAVAEAWRAGCYKVMLMTGSRQESTLRFYERAGFDRGSKTAFQIRRSALTGSDLPASGHPVRPSAFPS